jgi:hypothetical protein
LNEKGGNMYAKYTWDYNKTKEEGGERKKERNGIYKKREG